MPPGLPPEMTAVAERLAALGLRATGAASYPERFGDAWAHFESAGLRLRWRRDRGQDLFELASPHAPDDYWPLYRVAELVEPASAASVDATAGAERMTDFLAKHLPTIGVLFDKAHLAKTRQRLEAAGRAAAKRLFPGDWGD